MREPLPYRDFYFPLNAFMHILTLEEGRADALHYGLFESADDTLATAQERSTSLLLARLPPPPARILDVGAGLGTTLARLTRLGYDAVGITPDAKQIAMIRERYGDAVRAECVAFEAFNPSQTFDVVLFQESSQYIDSEALFAKAAQLAPRVVVLDEFALKPVDFPGALHSLSAFLDAARRHGFTKTEETDFSAAAPPTVDYFIARLPRYRERLIEDLGLTGQQVDDLIAGGPKYSELYRNGTYGYKLVILNRKG